MTGKLNVLGVGSETDFGVSFRVAESDFDSDLETSSGQGPTLGWALELKLTLERTQGLEPTLERTQGLESTLGMLSQERAQQLLSLGRAWEQFPLLRPRKCTL